MTKHEVIDAYVLGEIDRRDFVRRLTALGVSAGAALAYAQTLAPRAAAAGGSPSRGGFIVRAQADDGEYGTPIGPEEVEAAVLLLVDFANYILALVTAGLQTFRADDLEAVLAGLTNSLSSIIEQVTLQLAAIQTAQTQIFGKQGTTLQVDPGETIDAFLDKLQTALDGEAAVYAGVVPVVEDIASRVTLSSIGMVVARQAAYVRSANGEAAFPAAFEAPLSVEEGRALLTELQAS